MSDDERAKLLSVANEPRFCAVPPARIVPMLADEGVYLASEATFARVLRAHGQTAHRGRAKAPKARRPPTTHIATAARQVWCWDMTYLPATVIGRWFHLYLILDLYSRKIVGWEVHDSDHSDHAVHLVRRTALAEGIAALTDKPVLHGDNGSTLKATTVLAMLNWLGVKPSYSRPRVSDDNAYAESLFRTAKYRPEFPAKGFETLQAAREWGAAFVHWYNLEHKHSGIRYVSPQQRHTGKDHAILAARHALYTQAKAHNPARWARHTRNWSPVGAVTYKSLAQVERAFRSIKTMDLKVRPIHHRLENRVRAHIFLCMLAYYVEWHMRQAWAPLMFADEDQAAKLVRDPVAPATRSDTAMKKVQSRTLEDGSPVHSFQTLMAQLQTVVRNTCRTPGGAPDAPTFEIITKPNQTQKRALDLIDQIKP